METKELVEKEGYQVIYGDTDSIMVNTNDTDINKAGQIARQVVFLSLRAFLSPALRLKSLPTPRRSSKGLVINIMV